MPRATSLQAKFRALSKKKLKRLRRNQPQPKQQGKSLKSETKRKLRDQYGDWCIWCNHFVGDDITLHHIRWKSQGGNDTIENGSLLCKSCQQKIHKLEWGSKELQKINKIIQERKKFG